MQVLKKEIRESIINAAIEEFYQMGFTKASIHNIAKSINISTGNIYRYFKNKENLFEEILRPLTSKITILLKGESQKEHQELLNSKDLTKEQLFNFIINSNIQTFKFFLPYRKQLLILIDKSNGTKFENYKNIWINHIIEDLEKHFGESYKIKNGVYDIRLARPAVISFMEGIFEIFRLYKDEDEIMFLIGEYIKGLLNGAIFLFQPYINDNNSHF